ncbi:MAG TPA: adaptor protein MecA [Pseudogracilibacillus sp.]|nr:adaptor protein MecA [Pseudogracilibacillus sp.]
MEIERINDNTVKFYISYIDIENRGFEREEIWYNRERSEQLFWQMMDEVNYKEDFSVEGPLWIQVQALEKGLEIIVTKAQISKDEAALDAIDNIEETVDISLHDKAKSVFEMAKTDNHEEMNHATDNSNLWMTTEFSNFEDVIQLSHYFQGDFEKDLVTSLYYYEGKYYLYLEITEDLFDYQDEILSQVLEYSEEADVTYHLLDEYAKLVISDQVFHDIRKYFHAEINWD